MREIPALREGRDQIGNVRMIVWTKKTPGAASRNGRLYFTRRSSASARSAYLRLTCGLLAAGGLRFALELLGLLQMLLQRRQRLLGKLTGRVGLGRFLLEFLDVGLVVRNHRTGEAAVESVARQHL